MLYTFFFDNVPNGGSIGRICLPFSCRRSGSVLSSGSPADFFDEADAFVFADVFPFEESDDFPAALFPVFPDEDFALDFFEEEAEDFFFTDEAPVLSFLTSVLLSVSSAESSASCSAISSVSEAASSVSSSFLLSPSSVSADSSDARTNVPSVKDTVRYSSGSYSAYVQE